MAGRVRRHLLRRALCDHRAAAGTAFGAHVDDPVGRLDDVEVVLDHHDRVAGVAQLVQHGQQQRDVGEVQAGWSARRGCTACGRFYFYFLIESSFGNFIFNSIEAL